MHHHHNYQACVPKTRGVRTSNTMEFFPDKVSLPATSSEDRLASVTEDLLHVLQQPHPSTPFLNKGTTTNDAIKQLQRIINPRNTDDSPPRVPHPSPRVTSTRVLRSNTALKPIIEEPTIYPVTTVTKKKFGKHVHTGVIKHYDETRSLYFIECEDGDTEEMSQKEATKYRCPKMDKNTHPKVTGSIPHRANIARKQKSNHNSALPPHCAMAVFDEATGKMMECRHSIDHDDPTIKKAWQQSGTNEFGRLLQCANNGSIEGTDTMKFIKKSEIPQNKKVTYARFCCDIRPQKDETHRTRMTAGGDRLEYEGKTSTETASLETIKMHLNSVISTPGAQYLGFDI